MKKKQGDMLEPLVMKMLKSFKEDFFDNHLQSITLEEDLNQEEADYLTINLLFSFASSAFLSVVMPILLSADNKDKAIVDAEILLKNLRIMMMNALKGHTPIGKKVN